MKPNNWLCDCYAEACYRIGAAALPFTTVGMIGNKVIFNISVAVGAIAVVFLFSRWFVQSPVLEKTQFCKDVDDILAMPYAFALSSAIAGLFVPEVASSGYWFALVLSIFIVIGNHIKKRTAPAD